MPDNCTIVSVFSPLLKGENATAATISHLCISPLNSTTLMGGQELNKAGLFVLWQTP